MNTGRVATELKPGLLYNNDVQTIFKSAIALFG